MDAQDLFDKVIQKGREISPDRELAPLQIAILEEACEKVATAEGADKLSDDALMFAALQSLQTCMHMMQATVRGALSAGDIVNINYRGRTFSYTRESPFVTAEL